MDFDIGAAWDAVKDGTREFFEASHEKTSSFHENYVSKIVPDLGKYGDEAKFVAEMVPGVAEYNAIKDGDWVGFAIAAGIDVTAIAAGVFTVGSGYAAVKGGTALAKTGVKVAAKEIAEAGAEKLVKEAVEAGIEKFAKEAVEAGVEKVAKEAVEAGAEKLTKEAVEAGAEKVVKEAAEAGVEKITKDTVETGAEVMAKEVSEAGSERVVREATESGAEAAEKLDQITKNKLDGTAREEKVLEDLVSANGEDNVIREALLRDKDGIPIKDPETGEARRIDFIVTQGKKIIESIEVTSETADKVLQMAKETRILQEAAKNGGAFIRDKSGELIEFTMDIITEIRRLP